MKNAFFILILMGVVFLSFLIFDQDDKEITLMATTTTQDSGILSTLVNAFKQDSNINVKVIAYGTGKELRSAMDGNADVILVHDPLNEANFIKNGYGTERVPLMQNDFVIVGPNADPARIKTSKSATEAFEKIAKTSLFVSRGDESGTHNAEQRIWEKSTLNSSHFSPKNYVVTGSGMGRTLGIAVEKQAYVLTDKATWLSYKNKGLQSILYENDPYFQNIYSVIPINPVLFNHISQERQQIFMDWIKSNSAKELIQNFQISSENPFIPLIP